MQDTVTKSEFHGLVKKYDIIWFGEIHGIRENYSVYKKLIPDLAKAGFRDILWEMDADFNEKSAYSEDGRINSRSVSFLRWLQRKKREGLISRLTFFGEITNKNTSTMHQNNEEKMADQVIKGIQNDKIIVITGNFHMGGPYNLRIDIKPCSCFVSQKTNLKILKMAITYAGGSLYNFGIKHMSGDFYFSDKSKEGFGSITRAKEEDTLFLSAGKAHAVFKKPD